MRSLIFRTSSVFLLPALLVFSFVVLLRGHNEPGGGFVGGLLAASAFSLYALAYSVEEARRLLPLSLTTILGLGLSCALLSGAPAMFYGDPWFTGVWPQGLPAFGEVKFGTVMLFDIGVYLVVLSITLMMILSLAEDAE